MSSPKRITNYLILRIHAYSRGHQSQTSQLKDPLGTTKHLPGGNFGLEAAHILADSEGGTPIVPNGISLCRIHHGAFDHLILGI